MQANEVASTCLNMARGNRWLAIHQVIKQRRSPLLTPGRLRHTGQSGMNRAIRFIDSAALLLSVRLMDQKIYWGGG
jgi:hypothetical protein